MRYIVFDGPPVLTDPIPMVAAGVNQSHCFVFGPGDVPHIAAGDLNNNEALYYTTRSGIDWMPEIVDPEGGVAAAIALGPMAEPQIFYLAVNVWKFRHARREVDNSWTISDVEDTIFEFTPSLAVDADGTAWAAWNGNAINLKIANNQGGAWTVEEVPNTGSTGNNDTEIGPDGTVYVAYEHYEFGGQSTSMQLLYNRDGIWTQRELLPPHYRGVAMAIDEGWIHFTLAAINDGDVNAGQVLYFKLPVADGIDQDCDGDEW
jgi:hypothetical protein